MPDDLLGLTDWPGGFDDDFTIVERLDLEEKKIGDERRQAVEQVLRARKMAYIRVLVAGNSTQEDRDLVRADLDNFGRKKRSTFHSNTYLASKLDGRREVVLRIDEYLELSVDALLLLKVPNLGGS